MYEGALREFGSGPTKLISDESRDLLIERRHGVGIANIVCVDAAGAEAVAEILGTRLPQDSRFENAGENIIVSISPAQWLLVSDRTHARWSESIAAALAGRAVLIDQSGGLIVLKLMGFGATTLLSRGAYIDFHPAEFRTGCVATTMIAHVTVTIWKRDNVPSYEIAIPRSYFGSFMHWLEDTVGSLPFKEESKDCKCL